MAEMNCIGSSVDRSSGYWTANELADANRLSYLAVLEGLKKRKSGLRVVWLQYLSLISGIYLGMHHSSLNPVQRNGQRPIMHNVLGKTVWVGNPQYRKQSCPQPCPVGCGENICTQKKEDLWRPGESLKLDLNLIYLEFAAHLCRQLDRQNPMSSTRNIG